MDIQVILNMSTLNNKVAKISYERRIDQATQKGLYERDLETANELINLELSGLAETLCTVAYKGRSIDMSEEIILNNLVEMVYKSFHQVFHADKEKSQVVNDKGEIINAIIFNIQDNES